MNKIGTITESSLHAALKNIYAFSGDQLEQPVSGYYVDIKRADEIIEIQTGNFTALRPKLTKLLGNYRVRVIVPIALKRSIIRIAKDGSFISRRLSPKKGKIEDIFSNLVRIAALLTHPNLTIEVAFVSDEVYWIDDGKGSWRRKHWSIKDRGLVEFHGAQIFHNLAEFKKLIPPNLNGKFTSRGFAQAAGLSTRQAAKMLYCLRAMNIVEVVGRQGKSYLYKQVASN